MCVCGGGGGSFVTVSVNRVAMPGRTEGCVSVTMTVSCVTVSVNSLAMPGRTEGCVCVLGGVCDEYSVMCHGLCQQGVSFKNCVTVSVNIMAMPGRTEVCVYVMCRCVCQQGGDAG